MEAIREIVTIMIYPEGFNPIENILCSTEPLSCMFHEHSSKYQTNRGGNIKQRGYQM
jgi:hypothetical protein